MKKKEKKKRCFSDELLNINSRLKCFWPKLEERHSLELTILLLELTDQSTKKSAELNLHALLWNTNYTNSSF